MNLSALRVQCNAVIAEPIAAVSRSLLILRDVAAGRARAVVVVNALVGWFLNFINGVELSCWGHGISPSAYGPCHIESVPVKETLVGHYLLGPTCSGRNLGYCAALFGGQALGAYDAALEAAFASQSNSVGVLAAFSQLGMQCFASSRLNDAKGGLHGVFGCS